MRSLLFMVAAALILLPGCVDEISFNIPRKEEKKMVIVGRITKGNPSVATVTITRTSDFDPTSFPDPVEGANVQILDEDDKVLTLTPSGKGVYTANVEENSEIEVIPGRSFRLLVETAEGVLYSSEPEKLHDVPKAKGLDYTLITRQIANSSTNLIDQTYLQFSVSTPVFLPDSEEGAYLKWDFEGVYQLVETPPPGPGTTKTCYIPEPLNLENITLFNGNTSNTPELDQYQLFEEELDFRFADGYYLTAYQRSISAGAFTYWDQVSQSTAREGGLFEPPPGPIVSNLFNENDPGEPVLGYFFVESVDTVRLFLNFRGQADIRPKGRCEPPVDEVLDFCSDCLLRERSTLEKPDYWIE